MFSSNNNIASSSPVNKDKTDSLDIRAITSASRARDGKRQKYRMQVSKASAVVVGSKITSSSDPISKINTSTSWPEHQMYIDDQRAPSLHVDYNTTTSQFSLLPSTERFSAHTGICQILGSKNIRGSKFKLEVGEILRFGSVGLIVTEIATPESTTALSASELKELVNTVVSVDEEEETAREDSALDTDDDAGADDEEEGENTSATSPVIVSTASSNGPPTCYVCYDEGEDDNPLISPCNCTGDTKYIHVECLKRWNTGDDENEVCLVLDESNNLRSCTICKSPYPSTTTITGTSKVISLLPDRLSPPSVTFMIVTKHSSTSNSALSTNTKYQLSLATLTSLGLARPLLVGRSSQCDMVLKYRTVSTVHAEIHYSEGNGFFVSDMGSSNGTLRYIYKPLMLKSGNPVHVKLGRTIVSLRTKKRLSLVSLFSGLGISSNSSPASSSSSSRSVVPPPPTFDTVLPTPPTNITSNEGAVVVAASPPVPPCSEEQSSSREEESKTRS